MCHNKNIIIIIIIINIIIITFSIKRLYPLLYSKTLLTQTSC